MKKIMIITLLFSLVTLRVLAQPQPLFTGREGERQSVLGPSIEEGGGGTQVEYQTLGFGGTELDDDYRNTNPSVPVDGGVFSLLLAGLWLGRSKLNFITKK